MSKGSSIQWTDQTINFWWGCTKVSPACAHCYAAALSPRFSPRLFGRAVEWGHGKPRAERLQKARAEALALDKQAGKKGIRYRVFVNSMSDWLDEEVPDDWRAVLIQTIFECPKLDFQLLTKRPDNFPVLTLAAGMHLIGYRDGQLGRSPSAEPMLSLDILEAALGWSKSELAPSNVWIGTTVENQEWANKRIPELLKIPARVRFLSCEPLLGPVDLSAFQPFLAGDIHWVIAGGESGAGARPTHPDWLRSLRDQCQAAGVAFFFKQWGAWFPHRSIPTPGKNNGAGIYLLPDGAHGNQGDYWAGRAAGLDRASRKNKAPDTLDGVPHLAFPTFA